MRKKICILIVGSLLLLTLGNLNINTMAESEGQDIIIEYFFNEPEIDQVDINGTTYDRVILENTTIIVCNIVIHLVYSADKNLLSKIN